MRFRKGSVINLKSQVSTTSAFKFPIGAIFWLFYIVAYVRFYWPHYQLFEFWLTIFPAIIMFVLLCAKKYNIWLSIGIGFILFSSLCKIVIYNNSYTLKWDIISCTAIISLTLLSVCYIQKLYSAKFSWVIPSILQLIAYVGQFYIAWLPISHFNLFLSPKGIAELCYTIAVVSTANWIVNPYKGQLFKKIETSQDSQDNFFETREHREMKYCSHCGKEIMDAAIICPNCGCSVSDRNFKKDTPSAGLNVLSFFIPLVGLILYIIYHNDSPNKAKGIAVWALIGFVFSIILVILYYGSALALVYSLT